MPGDSPNANPKTHMHAINTKTEMGLREIRKP